MYKKVITKDCPSCPVMIINDNNQFQCNWGKAKKVKTLEYAKGKARKCNLMKNSKKN